jgi:hypothetical protein
MGGPGKRSAALYVEVTNRGDRSWAAPEPVVPLNAQIRFTFADGGPAGEWISKKMLLPLGIAPNENGYAIILVVDTDLPEPGQYRVDVSVPDLGWTFLPTTVTEVSSTGTPASGLPAATP